MTVKKIIISLFLLMLLFDGQVQLKTETEAASKRPNRNKSTWSAFEYRAEHEKNYSKVWLVAHKDLCM